MPTNELGRLLRDWRGARGKSQLDLSIDTGISQRHLSFVESGRSVPSRETLLRIAGVLDVPLRDRNGLLLASGYAPIYPESAWDSAEMGSVTNALKRMLHQHEPFPAVVMDRYWNVLMANAYQGKADMDLDHFEDAADLFGTLATMNGFADLVLAEKAAHFFKHASSRDFVEKELPKVLERLYPPRGSKSGKAGG